MDRPRPLPAGLDLLALHRQAPARYPLLLESVAGGNALSRWDLLFIASGEGLVLDADGVTRTFAGTVRPGRFLDALDADWRAQSGTAAGPAELPFRGGWGLYLGYELAAEVERLRIERDYLLHKVEDYQKPPVRVEGGNATVRIISGSVSADRVTDAMRGEP